MHLQKLHNELELCRSFVFNKILLKKRFLHMCFPMNFVTFLRAPFFIEHLWCLYFCVVEDLGDIRYLRWKKGNVVDTGMKFLIFLDENEF